MGESLQEMTEKLKYLKSKVKSALNSEIKSFLFIAVHSQAGTFGFRKYSYKQIFSPP